VLKSISSKRRQAQQTLHHTHCRVLPPNIILLLWYRIWLAVICRNSFKYADIEILQRIKLQIFTQLVFDDQLDLVVMVHLQESEMDIESTITNWLHYDFSIMRANLICWKMYMWTFFCYKNMAQQ